MVDHQVKRNHSKKRAFLRVLIPRASNCFVPALPDVSTTPPVPGINQNLIIIPLSPGWGIYSRFPAQCWALPSGRDTLLTPHNSASTTPPSAPIKTTANDGARQATSSTNPSTIPAITSPPRTRCENCAASSGREGGLRCWNSASLQIR